MRREALHSTPTPAPIFAGHLDRATNFRVLSALSETVPTRLKLSKQIKYYISQSGCSHAIAAVGVSAR